MVGPHRLTLLDGRPLQMSTKAMIVGTVSILCLGVALAGAETPAAAPEKPGAQGPAVAQDKVMTPAAPVGATGAQMPVLPANAGAPVPAGPPARPQDPAKFQLERMTNMLGLNEDQKAGFEKALAEQRSQTDALQAQLRDSRQKLDEALKAEKPEPATVGALVIEQHRLMQKGQATQEQANQAMRALLTAEQQAKFDSMRRFGPGGRMGRGMGPMGRPPGAPQAPGAPAFAPQAPAPPPPDGSRP
jgi:Spy/CpxP family protein refolding chaperone